MSIYPKVPTKDDEYANMHKDKFDDLVLTRGVTPKDLAYNKRHFSGDASKENKSKVIRNMMLISYNLIKVKDLDKPNEFPMRDRIAFAIALKQADSIINHKMLKDYDYYESEHVCDKVTVDKSDNYIVVLKKSKQWSDWEEIDKYFKWRKDFEDGKKGVRTSTKFVKKEMMARVDY